MILWGQHVYSSQSYCQRLFRRLPQYAGRHDGRGLGHKFVRTLAPERKVGVPSTDEGSIEDTGEAGNLPKEGGGRSNKGVTCSPPLYGFHVNYRRVFLIREIIKNRRIKIAN